jgi:hypothetical protein
MTIQEQAQALIDKYRPYTQWYYGNGGVNRGTRNATHCAILEVKAELSSLR